MPVHNDEVASVLEQIADLLEIEMANPFRIRAYRNAARTLRGLSRELDDLMSDGMDLTSLPGIGKDLAAKIAEILHSGHSTILDKLHKDIPAGVEDLLKLPGLGPKRVNRLYHELGIRNRVQLESAVHDGRLRKLPGFGAKTVQKILDYIVASGSTEKRLLRNTADAHAGPLMQYLHTHPSVKQAIIAGSYRRGRETVGDLDILVTSSSPETVVAHFTGYDKVVQVIASGPTRSSVILDSGLQVDLRVVEKQSFGAAFHYFTGSKAHNIKIRRLAQQQGLRINEYGVYRGNRKVAGETEQSVFDAVGLPYIPPELREDRGEIRAALENRLPELVQRRDLKGDLHTHSQATDGLARIQDMAMAARKHGLAYIAITDHSRHLAVAHGLDAERLLIQASAIDRMNEKLKGITLLKGVEVDILEDGSLDLPDDVLAGMDLVVAAVHDHFSLSRQKQTNRVLRAMNNRYFSILAHPSGRQLPDREPYNIDMNRIIRMAAQRGCFLELNCQPQRLDLIDIYCQQAKSEGVLISINSDAHRQNDFDNLAYGINQARRGWLAKADVLNTRPLKILKQLLRRTMS